MEPRLHTNVRTLDDQRLSQLRTAVTVAAASELAGAAAPRRLVRPRRVIAVEATAVLP